MSDTGRAIRNAKGMRILIDLHCKCTLVCTPPLQTYSVCKTNVYRTNNDYSILPRCTNALRLIVN